MSYCLFVTGVVRRWNDAKAYQETHGPKTYNLMFEANLIAMPKSQLSRKHLQVRTFLMYLHETKLGSCVSISTLQMAGALTYAGHCRLRRGSTRLVGESRPISF